VGFRVIADEDTVAGFRYAGVPGVVVATAADATREFRNAAQEGQHDVIITTERIANLVREEVNAIRFREAFPLVVEIPGPEGPAQEGPSLLKMIRDAVGIRF
jgi:V/A-type H+-transporting ATPase subunit F